MIIGPIAIGFVAYFHLLFGSELTRIIPSDNPDHVVGLLIASFKGYGSSMTSPNVLIFAA
jgi:hypothetical protein